MPLTRIKSSAIGNDSITTAKLANSAVTSIKTSNLFTNTEISGTEAARMPVGTNAQREGSPKSGDIRFNSTIDLMEYYDGATWKYIDSAPVVQSISPSNIADTSTSTNIVISVLGVSSSFTVQAIGSDDSVISASSASITGNGQVTAVFNGTQFNDSLEDYKIRITNTFSNLSSTSAALLSVNASPVFTKSAGSLGTIYNNGRTGISFTCPATDDEGSSLTFSISSGALPTGLSIDSSTGTITGSVSAVGSDTTYTFGVSVSDGSNTSTRTYTILVKSPYTEVISTSGTWTVPNFVTTVDVRVAAGGGGGGGGGSGGGCGVPTGGGGGAGANGASISNKGSNGSTGGNYLGGNGGNGGGSDYNSSATYSVTAGNGIVITIGAGGAGGVGGVYRGGAQNGSFGGRGGAGGSVGSQTSFGGFITTSGTSGTSVSVSGTAFNGGDGTTVYDAGYHNNNYNGKLGGTGGSGAVELIY